MYKSKANRDGNIHRLNKKGSDHANIYGGKSIGISQCVTEMQEARNKNREEEEQKSELQKKSDT